jgi:hypothetical protein
MSKFISPMEASLSRPVRDRAGADASLNAGGHVYVYGDDDSGLKHLLAPQFPNNLLAEGQFSGSRGKVGGVAGQRYTGFFDTPSHEPESPAGKTSKRRTGA